MKCDVLGERTYALKQYIRIVICSSSNYTTDLEEIKRSCLNDMVTDVVCVCVYNIYIYIYILYIY